MPPSRLFARTTLWSAVLSLGIGLGVALVGRSSRPGLILPDWTQAFAAALLGFTGMVVASWLAVRDASSAPKGDSGGPVRRRDPAIALLAVLQREGRLVDFLREDIATFPDAQVGAAARTIHASCRKVLDEHLLLEPVRTESEGSQVVIPNGFDPSIIRLTGKVGAKPPFRGVLRHRGWRTHRVELPADPAGQDPSVIAPAEVEIR